MSTKGLGACLLQDEKLIYFASKALTKTQKGYVAIEIESLAVAWAVKKFHHFLYGCHFILETDQKPLEAILSRSLNQATARLQSILIRTLPYNFTVRYIPGPKNLSEDYLSSTGYLPISLVTPLKLQQIISSVKESLIKTNPDYNIVIKRLHLYYDMKLVTFGIDQKRNLILQFLIFVQPYTQQPLILYQLEMVPVPIVDENTKTQSYTELKIKKPYISLNSETYINIQQQELATCKRIGYEFYCEELFVVRHKSIHSCKSAIYFNLDTKIIK